MLAAKGESLSERQQCRNSTVVPPWPCYPRSRRPSCRRCSEAKYVSTAAGSAPTVQVVSSQWGGAIQDWPSKTENTTVGLVNTVTM